MAILVTGGAGYIGSHTCVELLNAGYEVVVVDDLSNSSQESLRRVEEITGKKLTFYQVDILDRSRLERVFGAQQIDSVIHFAGFKAVGESVSKPWEYYYNNITGTLVLCDAESWCEKAGVQFFRHRLRKSGHRAHQRGFPPVRHQSLRQNQADD